LRARGLRLCIDVTQDVLLDRGRAQAGRLQRLWRAWHKACGDWFWSNGA
jgi:hypothetical protein